MLASFSGGITMRFVLSASLVQILVVASSLVEAGQARPDRTPVMFTKDIAPILQKNCQVCHRPGAIAPMSLLTYAETRPWARSIKLKVSTREMPPWYIDKNIGVQQFSNDRSLTDDEITTIVKWVDAGAPQGDPADLPPPHQFPDSETWQIGKPDLIVSLPRDIVVPSRGPDRWPDILVDPQLAEDRYIQGVQILPTKGFSVIHHIRTSIVEPADAQAGSGRLDASDGRLEVGEQGVFLNEYALGKQGDVFPEGSARLIKAGTKINFQLHLHPGGKDDNPANVALGLKFYPKGYVPRHVISSTTVSAASEVDLRPHTDNIRSDGYLTLKKAARLLSFQPHMHNRGKAECLEAIYPTGRVEMLSCARFRFNWHVNYVYRDDAAPLLPAGTVLHAIMWHDNTAANPSNPDPDAQITYGQRTIDEMASAWISWYYMSDDDFTKETEARRVQQSRLTGSR
jgi:hypothetical protein